MIDRRQAYDRWNGRLFNIACEQLAKLDPSKTGCQWAQYLIHLADSGPVKFYDVGVDDIVMSSAVRDGLPGICASKRFAVTSGEESTCSLSLVFEDGAEVGFSRDEFNAAGFERTTSDKFQ